MRRRAGQAAREMGRWTHRLARVALLLAVLAAVGLGAALVRLAQGPVELPWLAQRLEDMANAGDSPARLAVGGATLAWLGLHGGAESPVTVVLRDVSVTDASGAKLAQVPRVLVSVGLLEALSGQVALRSVELDGVRLRVLRAPDGSMAVDLGGMAEVGDDAAGDVPDDAAVVASVIRTLAAPPGAGGAGRPLFRQLRRVVVRDAAMVVIDRQMGAVWRAPSAEVEINRGASGGAGGTASVTLAVGAERLHLGARLALLPGDAGGIVAALDVSTFVPRHLAQAESVLAPLAAVDAPVTLTGTVSLAPSLAMRRASLSATLGEGRIAAGTGSMPVRGADVSARLEGERIDVSIDRLAVAPREAAVATTIAGHADATREGHTVRAHAALTLDQVRFEDLPVLWPEGVGGPGTRPWITENVTSGIAKNGSVSLSLVAPDDFSDATVTDIAGGLDGEDVTVHWLRPVPPVEHAEAHLMFADPDTIDVLVTAGRQAGTALAIEGGRVRLTGIAGHDQFVAIDAGVGGPFADLLGLLHHKRLKLFDHVKLDLRDPRGQVAGRLTVNLPLKNDLDVDNVAIHGTGTLAGGHLAGIAAGRDLDNADLAFDVGNDGMKLSGPAAIAGLPVQLQAAMDFRAGPPAQVLQSVTLSASVDAPRLASLGLDTRGALTGTVSVQGGLVERRDGSGQLDATADLTGAGIDVARARWSKAAGVAGTAEVTARLANDRFAGLSRLRVSAPDLAIEGDGDSRDGGPSVLRLSRLRIGAGTDVSGELRFPAQPGQAYGLTLSGARLDLSGEFGRRQPGPAKETRGPAYVADATIGRVTLGGGDLTDVVAHLASDGLVATRGDMSGRVGDGPFAAHLGPGPSGRVLSFNAEDGGGLLRVIDVTDKMAGGRLNVVGAFDDGRPGRPLTGTAEYTDFRVRDAPAMARLLQAMSLYGLVEIAQGPGLGFSSMVAPFTLADDVLTLADARAFNASLGMTAKGKLDLARHQADLQGTIVPAYLLNQVLGRIPLLGRLFSPEEGGGVFAATYTIRGPFDDPQVGVNPLAALTPGFLRGVFDMFNAPGGAPAAPQGSEGAKR